MIATSIFLNACAAQRTKGYIALILLYPTKELFLHGFLTGLLSMPHVSTLKAYLSFTCWACQMHIILVFSPDVGVTSWFWTPTNHFVRI